MSNMEKNFSPGDIVEARNPSTNLVERGTVVKFTSNNWLHVDFSGTIYRIHPQTEKVDKVQNFDNVYTVEMKTDKAWEVIFTTVSSQQALNEFCRCDSADDGYQYRLTSMLTPVQEIGAWAERVLMELEDN